PDLELIAAHARINANPAAVLTALTTTDGVRHWWTPTWAATSALLRSVDVALHCRPGRPRFQSLLHETNRRSAERMAGQPVFPRGGARALRAGPSRAAGRDRCRQRVGAGRRVPEPHASQSGPARIRAPHAVDCRRTAGAPVAHAGGTGGIRASRPTNARRRGGEATKTVGKRSTPTRGGHARHRGTAGCEGGEPHVVRAAASASRRPRVDRAPSGRNLRRRMGIQRGVRGASRRNRCGVRAASTSVEGALLDRRKGPRDRRLGLPGPQIEDRCKASTAARRTVSARSRHWFAPHRRMRALRKAGWLSEDYAVDAE